MRSSGIVTVKRVAAALGQFSEESGGFSVMQESLSYSAQRLCVVWPNRFPNLVAAAPYANNPEALANLASTPAAWGMVTRHPVTDGGSGARGSSSWQAAVSARSSPGAGGVRQDAR